jgi:hypothetical protein
VNNNPISNREIDGRYFDEPNEKAAQKIEKNIDKRVAKLEKEKSKMEKKGKDVADITARIGELGKSKTDIANMRSDEKTEYKYGKLGGKEAKKLDLLGPSTLSTGTNAKGDGVVTMFTENNMGSKLHEGRHGGQSARKEYDIKTGAGYGVQEEIGAYRAQYSYDGTLNYMPQVDLNNPLNVIKMMANGGGMKVFEVVISNINAINANVVNSMYDTNNLNQQAIYPPPSMTSEQFNKN